jgi:iron complex outermembrane receptor protein
MTGSDPCSTEWHSRTLRPSQKKQRGLAVTRLFVAAGVLTCYAIALWPGTPACADATLTSGGQELQTVVIEATAIPGSAVDADKIPGNVQTLSSADLTRDGSANLTAAMDSHLASVNINDTLDDPFQPDILFRGFEASPVLGTPQGLAVYQNGVRINEAFGDTVNWDLFPDIAINRVDLVSSSPVYGLNALGGGVSIRMKDGFSYHGSDVELSGGSFGNHAAAVQYGANSENFAIYVAGNALQNTGWRPYSDDSLRQLYAVLSAHTDRATLDLSYTRGDNQMDGQGPTPVQESAVNRSLVFTGPQTNINRLNFVTLNGSLKVTDTWSVQSLVYYRQYQQVVSNGNTTDYTACTTVANAGDLCQSDAMTPVNTSSGQLIPDISDGGTLYIGENDFETINAYGRGAALQTSDSEPILGHGNVFTAGAVLDYAELNFLSGAQIGLINSQLFVEPSPWTVDTPESSPFGGSPVNLKGVNRDFGAYVTDTFDVTPEFSLTASGRYNSAAVDIQDLQGTALTGNNRFYHFNPAIGGTYKVLPTLTAYVGIAQNTRTPTASEIECSNPLTPCLLPTNLAGDPPNLKQVVAHTLEFGVRGKIPALSPEGGTISWNLGAFRTQLDDDIYGIATTISTGFFQNIGSTRREGIEAGLNYQSAAWSGYFNYSYVDATFESPLTLPSPSNPYQDANGNIQVQPGDRLPGIPQHRIKAGVDYRVLTNWTVGASVRFVSDQYYVGDESNQNPPLPSYQVFGLHSSYQATRWLQVFAHIDNLLNAKYATYGVYSDPTGIGAPGIPVNGVTNGAGVDNRFLSPAYPFAIYGGVRITF